MREFAIIDTYLRPLAKDCAGAMGLTDDAAFPEIPDGETLVVSKDAMTAGVHFLADDPADSIARKLLRVNLSDLAAKGAAPLGYLLALIVPKYTPEAWIRAFTKGLAQDQSAYGVPLLGGDISATEGPIVLSLTILGTVPSGQALLRSGARVGDRVAVSGTIGDAALGLRALHHALPVGGAAYKEALAARLHLPSPRMALGRALRGIASAAVDISDGLLADAGHVCAASGVGMTLHADKVPLSEAARHVLEKNAGQRETVLTGGEDYELLWTLPQEKAAELRALQEAAGCPLTIIGEVTEGDGVTCLDANGAPVQVKQAGFEHL